MDSEGLFMVAVGAVIEHLESGRILLLQRSKTANVSPSIWEVVTGRMNQFEDPEAALQREIEEETGLRETEIVKPLRICHFYRGEPMRENEVILIMYWTRSAEDQVKLSEEHDSYAWVVVEEALQWIDHPGVRRDVEALIKERELTSDEKQCREAVSGCCSDGSGS